MTVTFAAEIDPTAARVFRLVCGDRPLGEWTGVENAYTEAHAHALVCDDDMCATYGAEVHEITDSPEVNLSNTNATFALEMLGYDTAELCGTDTADAFLGRVLMALAVAPADEGVPAHDLVPGEQLIPGDRQIDCGRRAGYLQDKLAALHLVAVQAQAAGRGVSWS